MMTKNYIFSLIFFMALGQSLSAFSSPLKTREVSFKTLPNDSIKAQLQRINKEYDLHKKMEIFKDFQQKYSEIKENTILFEIAREYIAMACFDRNDMKNGLKYAFEEKNNSFRGLSYKRLSDVLIAKKEYATAETLLTKGLSDARKDTSVKRTDTTGYASNYALLLYFKKEYQKGMVYADLAYHLVQRKWEPEITDTYALLLSGVGRNEEAFHLMDSLIYKSSASEAIKLQLPKVYAAVKGPDSNYAAYLKSRVGESRDRIKEGIQSRILNMPAADFSVKDVNGQTVSLTSLKGKTIILDFWATWCHPCIKSFSAMQMAVDKYRKDPTVVFLFIDTKEMSVPDPPEIQQKYISSKGYTLKVLFDNKDALTKTYPMAKSYNIVGLPTKYIIDKNGMIRFRFTGFEGSDEAAVEELSAMISVCKEK